MRLPAALARPGKVLWFVIVLGVFAAALAYGYCTLPWHKVAYLLGIAFACELMDSSLGMGYGTTLTPLLVLLGWNDPVVFLPTVLISELLTGFAASVFHARAGNVDFATKSPHFRIAAILSLGSIVGVSVGVQLAIKLSPRTLRLLIGAVILLAGITILIFLHRALVYRAWKMLVLATVAAFNKALSGGGYGPLMTSGQVLSGVEGKAAVGITSCAEAFTCLCGVVMFALRGKSITSELLVPIVTGALLSVPFAADIVSKTTELWMKRVIAIVTITLGALLAGGELLRILGLV